ncbi:hypothetical protein LBMAG42_14860 [Deltaproteobacteria bacterium]|nr:hypothetical protein LBMAG42_14860 [Deltaproteobacteria bacterium]
MPDFEAERPPGEASGWRGWLMLAALSLFLAIVVRWPLSVQPSLFPLDGNSGLHALAIDAAYHGSWSRIPSLLWPEGAPIRLLAVPSLVIGVVFRTLCEPGTALELTRTVWLAAGGVGVAGLAARLGQGLRGRAVAATLCIVSPITLTEAAGGRHEQHAYLPIALAVIGALGAGRASWALGFAGLLLAGFTSPYQLVTAAALALTVAAWRGWRPAGATLLAAVLAGIPVSVYYAPAVVAETMFGQPMTATPAQPALLQLVAPLAGHVSAGARLASLRTGPIDLAIGACWPPMAVYNIAFLGWVCLALGLAGGLAGGARIRPLVLGGLLCTLLGLGNELRLSDSGGTGVPLPWALAQLFPGLRSMQSTGRFLVGATIPLALAAGALAHRWRATALLAPLALVEGLFFAPSPWPLPAASIDVASLRALLPATGPVAVWPAPGLPPSTYALMALVGGRPIAGTATEHFRPVTVAPVGVTPPAPIASAPAPTGMPVIYVQNQQCAPLLQWRDRDRLRDRCVGHVCVHLVEVKTTPRPGGPRSAPR